jgi:hypothetical protein
MPITPFFMWEKLNKMKKIYLFVLIIFLISCSTNSDKIAYFIKKEIAQLPENAFIFVISEYDCDECVEYIYKWIADIKVEYPTYGLFGLYYARKKTNFRFDSFISESANFVIWKYFNNIEFMNQITAAANNQGPYVIKFSKRKIEYIQKVTIRE